MPLGVTPFKLRHERRKPEAARPQCDGEVKQEVRALGNDFPIVAAGGGERELDPFLANLLGKAPRTLGKEPGGIA